MKKIALKGRRGSFTHQLVCRLFHPSHELIFCDEFASIFDAVVNQDAFGVTPIENSLGGSVHETYDLLNEYEVHITAEHLLKVEHHLLGVPLAEGESFEERMAKCREVASHPQALRQTAGFLKKFPHIARISMLSTSEAAEVIAQRKDEALLAIASQDAATLYNLDILKSNIEDDANNYTRFVVLQRGQASNPSVDSSLSLTKYSLSVELLHQPGSLLRFLQLLEQSEANLTKLESRPIPGRPFHYLFVMDFEVKDTSVLDLERLRKNAQYFQLHGAYPPAES